MSNGLVKQHHGIMAQTAEQDYEKAKLACFSVGLPITTPTGRSWQKVEDATALMLNSLPFEIASAIYLNRGLSYYQSL